MRGARGRGARGPGLRSLGNPLGWREAGLGGPGRRGAERLGIRGRKTGTGCSEGIVGSVLPPPSPHAEGSEGFALLNPSRSLFVPVLAGSPDRSLCAARGAASEADASPGRQRRWRGALARGLRGSGAAVASVPAGLEAPRATLQVGSVAGAEPAGSPERSRLSAPGMPWIRDAPWVRGRRRLEPSKTRVRPPTAPDTHPPQAWLPRGERQAGWRSWRVSFGGPGRRLASEQWFRTNPKEGRELPSSGQRNAGGRGKLRYPDLGPQGTLGLNDLQAPLSSKAGGRPGPPELSNPDGRKGSLRPEQLRSLGLFAH